MRSTWAVGWGGMPSIWEYKPAVLMRSTCLKRPFQKPRKELKRRMSPSTSLLALFLTDPLVTDVGDGLVGGEIKSRGEQQAPQDSHPCRPGVCAVECSSSLGFFGHGGSVSSTSSSFHRPASGPLYVVLHFIRNPGESLRFFMSLTLRI